MANMMQSLLMAGSAESGFGVTLAGFHCPVSELLGKIEELKSKMPVIGDIAQWEDNGYVTVVACAQDRVIIPSERAITTFRREPHKLFSDLPKFLIQSKAQYVDRLLLTGSMGSISLTLLYRPVKETRV